MQSSWFACLRIEGFRDTLPPKRTDDPGSATRRCNYDLSELTNDLSGFTKSSAKTLVTTGTSCRTIAIHCSCRKLSLQ